MKHFFLILVILFILFDSTAQGLVRQYNKALEKVKNGDLKGAIILTKKLEKKTINKIYYAKKILLYSYKDSNQREFYLALKRLSNYSFYEFEQLNKNNFEKFPGWRDSLNFYFAISNKNHELFINQNLAILLTKMKEREITHRVKVADFAELLKDNKISFDQFKHLSDSVMNLQKPLDKLNQHLFDSIVNAEGELPNYQNVGFDGAYTTFLIIQHLNDITLRKKYIKMYEKLLPEFLLKVEYFPLIVDRTKFMDNKKLIFGMAVKYNEAGNKQIAAKLKRLRKVNKKRVLYGLAPLAK